MDLTQLLPEEVLADVLRRVAPHGLAACRSASKALCSIIDVDRLLLPISVGGIFINFHSALLPEFLARPSTAPAISLKIKPALMCFTFDPSSTSVLLVDGHMDQYAVNPATRQWDALPPLPSVYLVFDPAVSSHYEVFDQADPVMEESEWPPSVCVLHVFSSRSVRWEETSFIRDGKAAGTIADMQCWDWYEISLTNDRYQVIKPLIDCDLEEYQNIHLGRSEKGVYLATIFEPSRLMVWLLEELCGKTNWVLVHNNCLAPIVDCRLVLGPWVLQDINFNEYLKEWQEHNEHDLNLEYLIEKKLALNSGKKELAEEKFEWDSENDNILHKQDVADAHGNEYFSILGFHPYKEIVFLDVSMKRGLAYHLKDSKVQDLGHLYPTSYDLAFPNNRFITHSFAYTPYWTGHQKATRL
ncbi:hypothetical protein VPH35_026441 [Triticum aestivum]